MITASHQTPHVSLPALSEEILRRTATSSLIWNDSRRHARTNVNGICSLVLEPTYASVGRAVHSQDVCLRDLSRSGVRFLHAALLFPGEFGKLTIPTGAVYRLEIVWCKRIAPGIFSTGGQFVSQVAKQ
jgi:hypothetical protein